MLAVAATTVQADEATVTAHPLMHIAIGIYSGAITLLFFKPMSLHTDQFKDVGKDSSIDSEPFKSSL